MTNKIIQECPVCSNRIRIPNEHSIVFNCNKCGVKLKASFGVIEKLETKSSSETIIYQDEHILVSSARYRVDNTTYAMKDITSVTLTEDIAVPWIPIILWLIAIIHLFWPIGFLSSMLIDNHYIEAVLMFGIGLFINRFIHSHYVVTITNNSSQINTFRSTDRHAVGRIVESINQAIIINA